MKKLMLALVCLFVGSAIMTGSWDAVAGDAPEIIGAGKCKMCHKSAKVGNQYGQWLESEHAKAFETLASDESKAIATEKGLGDPQQAAECLACHTTSGFWPESVTGAKYVPETGVGCESCHGPGSLYKKKSVMIDSDASAAAGLIIPTEELCVKCHNEKSPTYKEFNFEEMLAKVQHPVPAKE